MDPDNEAAYADYVEQSWSRLVRAAIFLGARPHEAEDLAQATLVRCYTGWSRVSAADNREAYVYRMLLNGLRDSRRSRSFRTTSAYDDPHAALERAAARGAGESPDAAEKVAVADAVHRALGSLTKPNREVVVLRYFVQLTERQTAEALGIPPGTVKSRLSRALAHLASNDHLLDLSRGGHR